MPTVLTEGARHMGMLNLRSSQSNSLTNLSKTSLNFAKNGQTRKLAEAKGYSLLSQPCSQSKMAEVKGYGFPFQPRFKSKMAGT